MITPLAFQEPPQPSPRASHTVCTGPPAAAILLILPPAKNPMERLSADQKGELASSVPASGCAVTDSRARTHRTTLPSVILRRTTRRPSGETAKEPRNSV